MQAIFPAARTRSMTVTLGIPGVRPAGELGAALTKDGLIKFGSYNRALSAIY
jgi:hypothetical protein